MSALDGRMISSRRAYTSSTVSSPFIAASVSLRISALSPASDAMPSIVTSVESTSKKTWRYLLRMVAQSRGRAGTQRPPERARLRNRATSCGLTSHDLHEIGKALEEMIGLRRDELLARRRSRRHDRHIESAVARGADVDRHVADEERVFRIAFDGVEGEEQMLRLGLARAGHVGTDDRGEMAGEAEEVENLFREEGCLVRADGHLHAQLRQTIERRLDVGQHFRFRATPFVVARHERVVHAARHVGALECALQEALDAVADELFDARRAEIAQSVRSPRMVHGLGQRTVRIDERSIEIEQHSAVAT